jgi:hypothetical protein
MIHLSLLFSPKMCCTSSLSPRIRRIEF